eukprot:10044689-Ditylum_brightwellii.AAC.1
MQGSPYATCLDRNFRYYYFAVVMLAQYVCAFFLPWGEYEYPQLPQDLMISSEIYEAMMDIIFQLFEDVLIFINNIILYTK